MLMLSSVVCWAADFTVRDNIGVTDLVNELELRGLLTAVSSQVPMTAKEVMQALSDTGIYANYRQHFETMFPKNGYRFQATTVLSGTIGNHDRQPSAGSSLKLGMLGAHGDWSFVAVNIGQTGDYLPTTQYHWRGAAASSDQIYVRWSGPAAHVQIGKDYWSTGEGLALSDRQPFEQFQGHYDLSRIFRLTWFTGQLDGSVDSSGVCNRYLAGHRLELRTSRLCIGASEYMMYGGIGRGVEWYYLLPFYVFQGEQDNRPFDDNAIWDLDTKFIIPPVRVKLEIMIDDFQIESKTKSDKEPMEMGLFCNIAMAILDNPVFLTQNIDYQMVTGWTYNQNKPWNRWIYNNEPLGSQYGNDFDRLSLTTKVLGPSYSGEFELALLRSGEGSIIDPWTEPWVNDSTWVSLFPSGIIERNWTASIYGKKDFSMRYWGNPIYSSLSLKLQYVNQVNANHQPGVSHNDFNATLGFALGYYF